MYAKTRATQTQPSNNTGTIRYSTDTGTTLAGSRFQSCQAVSPALFRQQALFSSHYREIPTLVPLKRHAGSENRGLKDGSRVDASAGCVIDLLVAVTARQPISRILCSPGCPSRFHIMADGFWKVILHFPCCTSHSLDLTMTT